MNFPLYDNLKNISKKRDLTVAQKKKFINNIRKIDHDGHELIYALIHTHQITQEEGPTSFTLPYRGYRTGNNNEDIQFDLDELPIKLRHILHKFVMIHMEKLKEEQEKQKLVKI